MLCLLLLISCKSEPAQPPPAPPAAETAGGLALPAPPAGWQPRAKEKKAFLVDYDAPGGARVNVLPYDIAFEPYLEKVLGRWTDAAGKPLARSSVRVSELPLAAGLAGRTIELEGTRVPHEGQPEPGLALHAVHLTPMEGEGYWTVWLIGPPAAVAARREEYLAWVKGIAPR